METNRLALAQKMVKPGQSFKESFGDRRLDRRGNKLVKDLFIKGSHSIRQLSENSSAQKGNYCLLQNDRISEITIISSLGKRCGHKWRASSKAAKEVLKHAEMVIIV